MAAEIGGGTTHDQLRKDEFWAVNDVSLELRRGECLGLIGRNGAGKTTLLKMLNGLIKPDAGRITMRGRVGALIALGAGFNPILTGRENIYVNGSVLGLTKREIDAKSEEIIDFADIHDFIDSPVQSYSSGMQVRLGFAIATALDPDVLLLDEVLAVGDAAFRAKCYKKIAKLQRNASVIFVTHSMEQISRICTKAMCLTEGRVLHLGDVTEAVRSYNKLNTIDDSENESFMSFDEGILDGSVEAEPKHLQSDGILEVRVNCSSVRELGPCRLRVVFYAEDGSIAGEYDSRSPIPHETLTGKSYNFRKSVGPIRLLGGNYKLGINLLRVSAPVLLLWSYKQLTVAVEGPTTGLAHYQISAR
jgi:lipopolysaccharide transport system ATP-binding protein